ncbi:MAG: PIN domain protein [Leptospiraceae bacterium]|nr:PIN domain protein [Leptospiraceae bacterium]
MKIYLDMCCFNRPYDDQSSMTISLETTAKLMIQGLVKDGRLVLIWSFMLDYENQANPNVANQTEIFEWRKEAGSIVKLDNSILENAKQLHQLGLHQKDALHIAAADNAGAQRFITVDKGILRKSNEIALIKTCSPIEFIAELEE